MPLSRRHLLQSASAMGALGIVGCSETEIASAPKPSVGSNNQTAKKVLDLAQDFMLNAYPETASSMGIDKGNYAGLRSRLTDRTPAGQAKIAKQTRTLLGQLQAIDTSAIEPDIGLDVDVVTATLNAAQTGSISLMAIWPY